MRGHLLHRIAAAEYMKSLERTVASPASRLATDPRGETRMLDRESCNQHTPRLLMHVPKDTNNNDFNGTCDSFCTTYWFRFLDQDTIATFSPAPPPLILILR